MVIMIICSFYNPVKVMADNEKASINEAYYSGQEILTYNDDMLSVNDKELSDNSNTTDTSDKDGICQSEDGTWNYYRNGKIDSGYTGLAENEAGWWYVKDGAIDFSYTGLVPNENGWWSVINGKLDFGYTGLMANENGWWSVINGKLDFGYTGLMANENGWWSVINGKLDFGYTGLMANEYGWWSVINGKLDFGYTGLMANEYGWWSVINGKLDFGYTGLMANEYGWWSVINGKLDFGYTGLMANEYGWWYVDDGCIDFDYTGNVSDETGIWKVVNGHVESEVEQSFAAQLPAAEEYSQLVVVESEGVHATVTMHEKQDGVWTEILRTDGFVGSMGVGQASAYTSVTPQGTFPLYFAFGINPDPGTIIPYLQVDEYDYWVGDSWSDVYNQYVRTDSPYTEWDDAEHIIDYPDAYGYCLFIGYNMEGTPEAGSCYFLHCSNGRPTAGCVSVSEEDMAFILTHIGDSCGIVIE